MVDEDLLLQELDQAMVRQGEQAVSIPEDVVQRVNLQAASYLRGWKRGDGITFLKKARQISTPLDAFNRPLAIMLGSWAELVMRWADGLQVSPPPDLLATLEARLVEATQLAPKFPDPFWDLAVIYARFLGNYDLANKYLVRAMQLGYSHPMLPRLGALIQDRPLLPVERTDGAFLLRQWILKLAEQATGPLYPYLLKEREHYSRTTGKLLLGAVLNFSDYLHQAQKIVERGDLDEAQGIAVLSSLRILGGEPEELATNFIRRVAEMTGQERFISLATGQYLALLVEKSHAAFSLRADDPSWLGQALEAAERGLLVIPHASVEADPNLHAELLLAKGQALYAQQGLHVAEAMRCYHQALLLKRKADNQEDVERLSSILWKEIQQQVGRTMVSTLMGGTGEALEILEACAEAATSLEDPERAHWIQVQLALGKRQVGRYAEAESALRQVLQDTPSEQVAGEAQFELASLLAETGRPQEAAAIQKALLEKSDLFKESTLATLWSNYANSLMLLEELDEAYTALERAWSLLPAEQKQVIDGSIPQHGARVKMLMADVQLRRGNVIEANPLLQDALVLYPQPLGVDALHMRSIQARVQWENGDVDAATKALEQALDSLGAWLSSGPSLPTWESALQQWAHLDARLIQSLLQEPAKDGPEKALLRAEAAKGRTLAWLENFLDPNSAQQALSLARQEDGLANARQWLMQKPGRKIVSLFGAKDGLTVFVIDSSGQVRGSWLDAFHYEEAFRSQQYEPWEKLVRTSLSGRGTQASMQQARKHTEQLLAWMGATLAKADPDLEKGGSDLLIIPHRAFRNLPLAHARLPGGKSLGDVFSGVAILPSLGDFKRYQNLLELPGAVPATALADADGSLAFARCEAILSGAEELMVGKDVTQHTLRYAFAGPGTLLLSLHGDFDERNPWQSRIMTSSEPFPLVQFISGQTRVECQTVILGICEAGKSQRSVADEPLGFPALLLKAGAAQVLAPAWQVDDFASFLFMTRLFRDLRNGTPLASAYLEAAHWLRDLTAPEALERLNALFVQVEQIYPEGSITMPALPQRLDPQRKWLKSLPAHDKPFASPLDWAAFTLSCAPV